MQYQKRLIGALFQNRSNTPEQLSPKTIPPALSVYRNNYIENGIRALSITYRTVFGLLDELGFRKLATEYLYQYPKTCFDWADYGNHLSAFMLAIDEFSDMPYLPEIAEVDWRLMHIERSNNVNFDANSFALMQNHEPQELAFTTAAGLQTMNVIFPVLELYQLVHSFTNEDNSTKVMQNKKQHIININNLVNSAIKTGECRSIILWRDEHKGKFEYLDSDAHCVCESMLNKNSISHVLSHFGEDQNAITHWLQQQIQSKKICAVEII